MKHLKSILLATTLFLATSFTIQAQSKVAHINTQELASAMPEMRSAQSDLEKVQKSYQTEIQDMVKAMDSEREKQMTTFATRQNNLDYKIEQYTADLNDLSPAERKLREEAIQAEQQSIAEDGQKVSQDLQGMEQSIREFQANAQKEMQEKMQLLMIPITEEIKAAITKIGKAKGFDYVLDSSLQNSGVIYAGGTDLMQDVKIELGF